ncbi:DUF1851 domain-containing protein [Salmonella enterica]|uniref:DUF1851 domain-containing protein n=2 Tax=Salmonella enterica I TaxID=59201 RepID=A0A3V3S4V0_SALET|nr:DUF1851 domain-containing protein [Salmonella enterica subsp. arizonae]EAA7637797.1 DUF1851 domain-containing protein [Salmonella enterica subsp. enterica]EAA9185924.1 DUF1851 domain-containing protein [Salmonella enterica]EAQ4236913.1 DUF1851 domain-containing protein [Salmonella enterica subsp. enterica serovar Alachua]ECT7524813.1 DUF1851 domain-containing protein [Salmonella enterica subsp. enterica serovar Anatum]EDU6484879.1 DUF1851 domain-containing protein [Salmonella enterica subsp
MRPWFTGGNITILPLLNKIIFNENRFINKTKNILDSEITSFLASSSQEGFDLVDDNNNYLFDRTVKKLGALADNEMFGLEPAYILGGEIKIFLYSKN